MSKTHEETLLNRTKSHFWTGLKFFFLKSFINFIFYHYLPLVGNFFLVQLLSLPLISVFFSIKFSFTITQLLPLIFTFCSTFLLSFKNDPSCKSDFFAKNSWYCIGPYSLVPIHYNTIYTRCIPYMSWNMKQIRMWLINTKYYSFKKNFNKPKIKQNYCEFDLYKSTLFNKKAIWRTIISYMNEQLKHKQILS